MPRIVLPPEVHRLFIAFGLCAAVVAATYAVLANAAATCDPTAIARQPFPALHGALRQGGIVIGKTLPDMQVRLGDTALRVSPEGLFVFGFGRDAAPEVTLSVAHAGCQTRKKKRLNIEQREYQVQRIEGVPQKTVAPPREQLARIAAEGRMVREARAKSAARTDFARGFEWPLRDAPITGVYGSQRYYNGQPRRPHYGIDLAAPKGAPVAAPAAGVVTLAHPDMFFSGGTLIIDHGHGLSSTLMHLSKLHVELGQNVRLGQVVAEVGSSGRSTGPHLDWRMNWLHQRVDPQLIFEALPPRDK